MSAVKKVVDLLWYSPNYKNKRLANQLAAEFSELEEENKRLKKKSAQRPDFYCQCDLNLVGTIVDYRGTYCSACDKPRR